MPLLIRAISLAVAVCASSLCYSVELLQPPKGPVVLTISGNLERTNNGKSAQFDMQMLEALGRASFMTSSEVSEKPQLFEGVYLAAVLREVGARGKTIKASAWNDYEIAIPFDDLKFEPLIAMKVEGKVLTIRDKGPLWIVYPTDAHEVLHDVQYYARSVWQLNKLHVE
jgi:hypothetical protein